MYLTKMPINMTRRESRRMLASPYRMHAAIAGSFPPDQVPCAEGRILWRIDENPDGSAVLYIASPSRPSMVGLDEQIGWPDLEPQWTTRDYGPFLTQIADGQRYAFRLAANPTVSRKHAFGQDASSKRLAHLTMLQQAAWLVGDQAYDEVGREAPELFRSNDSRAMRNGFEVMRDASGALQLSVSHATKETFRQGSSGRSITIAKARYDGLIIVRDTKLLKHALTFGIGHAKGFGCGLMTLVPVGGR